ncbi:unnamed protein product, partial [Mesorhabditis spiculigera]
MKMLLWALPLLAVAFADEPATKKPFDHAAEAELLKFAKSVGRAKVEQAAAAAGTVDERIAAITALATKDDQKALLSKVADTIKERLQAAVDVEAKLVPEQKAVLDAAKATKAAHDNEVALIKKLNHEQQEQVFRVIHPLRLRAPHQPNHKKPAGTGKPFLAHHKFTGRPHFSHKPSAAPVA